MLKLLALITLTHAFIWDEYITPIIGEQVETEISGPGGMIYSVPNTIIQARDFSAGF